MSAVEVTTSLAQDGESINLLASGCPVQVILQPHLTEEGGQTATQPNNLTSKEEKLVEARATRLLTGEDVTSDVQIAPQEDGQHVLAFLPPEVTEREDSYSLAVLCSGTHVKGSPFLLRYVRPLALSSVHTEMKHAIADAHKPVNLIVPIEKEGETSVSIEGPFGQCQSEVRRHETTGTLSIHFLPKGAGVYSVCVMVDDVEIENSPFLVLADFSSQEALECYVLPEDEWVFERPLQFPLTDGGGQTFCVATEGALRCQQGPNNLTMLCSGPASHSAAVTLSKDFDRAGVERCKVVPSAPGDHTLSVLWCGQHVRGSPCVMRFASPVCEISGSRELENGVFELQVPYEFQLAFDSSEMDNFTPEVTCTQGEACCIELVSSPNSDHTHTCKLFPLLAGMHEISIMVRGVHVVGSPFCVQFKDTCDPSACKVIAGSTSYEVGGLLSLKVSTEGAGPGVLEASAKDPNSHIAVSLAATRITDHLYQLEFTPPVDSLLCDLSLTFNLRHIPGSPFRLTLSDPRKFKVHGEGLAGCRVGVWNSFRVSAVGDPPPPGSPLVKVRGEGGLKVEVGVSKCDLPHEFQVRYFPTVSGDYKIYLKWGHVPVPGSPFSISCSPTTFQVMDPPTRAQAELPLEFKVQLVSDGLPEYDGTMQVVTRTPKGRSLKGQAKLVDKNPHTYDCTLTPRQPGNYTVGVFWNKMHISGSPFSVKVAPAPKPEMVRVSGKGVEISGEVGTEATFTVETGRAGGGTLALRVRGPSKELRFTTRPDPANKRTLHAKYCPTVPGEHRVEVEWAGRHVPGSPFKVGVRERACTVVADVHSESVVVDMEGEGPRNKGVESRDGALSQSDTASEVKEGTESVTAINSTKRSRPFGLKKQDSGYSTITRTDHPYDPAPRGSISSLGSSMTSLYRLMQLDSRHCSDDQISIQLDGPMSLLVTAPPEEYLQTQF